MYFSFMKNVAYFVLRIVLNNMIQKHFYYQFVSKKNMHSTRLLFTTTTTANVFLRSSWTILWPDEGSPIVTFSKIISTRNIFQNSLTVAELLPAVTQPHPRILLVLA